ncbi:MAG TPA: HEAT repeat domain-containing protein [Verrucomicrobiae bacterium]|nr:HEAT repeat domain-containing protein [Verrucomicrobiae bacterium]
MKRKILLFVSVFVVAAGIGFLFFEDAQSARIGGKPVGFLLDEISVGGSRSNAAMAVILKEGRAAAPVLADALRYVSPARTNWIQLKSKLPWAVASRLPRARPINHLRRYSAAYALQNLGTNGKPGVPALLAAVKTGDVAEMLMFGANGGLLVGWSWSHGFRAVAIRAASEIDPDNSDVLATAAGLAAECEWTRGPSVTAMAPAYEAGMRALEAAERPSPGTIDRVLKIVHDYEEKAHLDKLGDFNEATALQALKSAVAPDRQAAAFALGNLDKMSSEKAVLALSQALKDSDERVRLNAGESLVKVGAEATATAMALASLLKSTNSVIRLRAVDTLLRMNPSIAADALKKAESDSFSLARLRATHSPMK